MFIAMSCACLAGTVLVVFGIFQTAAELRSLRAKDSVAACFPGFLGIFLAVFKKAFVFYIVYNSTQVYLCRDVDNGNNNSQNHHT